MCAQVAEASSALSNNMFAKHILGSVFAMLIAPALLTGCAMNNVSVDETMVSAVSLAEPAPSISADPFIKRVENDGRQTDRLLDEDTMRLAVTTVNPDQLDSSGVPWANAATGATGRITQVTENQVEDQLCRQFIATRQAYDGQSLYNGEVCLDRRTGWWTRSLSPVQ